VESIYANAATQDAFCTNAACIITKIYDQSPRVYANLVQLVVVIFIGFHLCPANAQKNEAGVSSRPWVSKPSQVMAANLQHWRLKFEPGQAVDAPKKGDFSVNMQGRDGTARLVSGFSAAIKLTPGSCTKTANFNVQIERGAELPSVLQTAAREVPDFIVFHSLGFEIVALIVFLLGAVLAKLPARYQAHRRPYPALY
jgi:hypothetical protein